MIIERDKYWDSIKGLLIILVVIGHFFQLGDSRLIETTINWIYSFHMPLFIIVSGYFSNPNSPNYWKGIVKIAETYIIVQLLRCVLEGAFDIHSIIVPRMALWYLLSLVYWKILLAICPHKMRSNKPMLISVSLAISCISGVIPYSTIMSYSRTCCFLPFFVIGYCMRSIDYKGLLNRVCPIFPIAFLIIEFLVFYSANQSFLMLFAGTESFASGIDNFFIQRLSIYICGTLMSFSMLVLVMKFSMFKFLAKLGTSTLFIYIYHAFIYMYILKSLYSIEVLPTTFISLLCYSIITIMLLLIVSKVHFFNLILNPFSFLYGLWKTRY